MLFHSARRRVAGTMRLRALRRGLADMERCAYGFATCKSSRGGTVGG
jgi:hypothetical protein